MAELAKENRVQASSESEGQEHGGMTMKPREFGLTAGSATPIQRQENTAAQEEERALPTTYPWIGLINQDQVGLHREPQASTPDSSNNIRPDLELSEGVTVLGETNGWLHIERKTNETMQGYVDRRYVSPMPGEIASSEHQPGIGYDGVSVHDDLKSGDLEDADSLTDITSLFAIQNAQSDETLFEVMTDMCTSLFAMGELETNILAMIAHFRGSSGTNYSNPILTEAARNHASTQRFITHITEEFRKKMTELNGDATQLTSDSLTLIGNPHFNTKLDIIGGLTIAVNDVWAYDVNVVSYDRAGDNYQAQIRLNLYDHFGLDLPDVQNSTYQKLAGFRAWYVLQHVRGYKPFMVDMPVDFIIDGTVGDTTTQQR